MVNQKVLVRKRYRLVKKFSKNSLIVFLILGIIIIIFFLGFSKGDTGNIKNKIILENPLKGIVFANTNDLGEVDKDAVIEQAIIEFNLEYINYLLVALKVNNLHKSYIGFGNPVVEMRIDNEVWSTEIINNIPQTYKKTVDSKDIIIILTKKEAVEALLSRDIAKFMKTSVTNGNTQIELVAGKLELGSKGYLEMYKEMTGEEAKIDE